MSVDHDQSNFAPKPKGAVARGMPQSSTAIASLAGSSLLSNSGLSPLSERVAEIHRSVEAGANEIDVVITRAHVFGARWQALYDEVATFKRACGSAHMKVILGTGDLLTFRNIARASLVAMMAGA